MFLTSDAHRALDPGQAHAWDWRSTTVLMICHEWDSARGGPEGLAGLRLAAALRDAGARLHVLTALGSTGDGAAGEVTVVPSACGEPNRLTLAAQMIRCRIPEPTCTWVADAERAGIRLLSSMPPDTIVYGRAMPGTSNIVAWKLARRTRRPWVAHFSDEWPPVQAVATGRWWRAPYKPPLFHLWRRRILRDAGALTFTNPCQADAVLGPESRYRSKAFVVTHLASPAIGRQPQQHERFHIVHTGNLNPPGHTSEALMRGLRLFLDRTPDAHDCVQFTQAGWQDGDMPWWAARCGLGDVVRFAGRLPQPEVAALLADASLLVGIDYARANSTTLLSKLPDYVSAGRPILVITARSSAMGRLFDADGVGLTASFDAPEEVAGRIAAVYRAWCAGRDDAFLPRETAVASFGRRHALAELGAAFLTARRACAGSGERSRAVQSVRHEISA